MEKYTTIDMNESVIETMHEEMVKFAEVEADSAELFKLAEVTAFSTLFGVGGITMILLYTSGVLGHGDYGTAIAVALFAASFAGLLGLIHNIRKAFEIIGGVRSTMQSGLALRKANIAWLDRFHTGLAARR